MKRRSLRIQITVAVGAIVALACLALTLNSIHSAKSYYVPYLKDAAVPDSSMEPPAEEINWDYVEEDKVDLLNRDFSIQGLGVMAFTIGASLLFTWLAAGRLLRPLEKLTDTMNTIDQGRLDERLPIPNGTSEVQRLTESYNRMLQRLEESFQVQKRFAADAAHELKTPLASIKTAMQVLQMDSSPSTEEYQEFVADTGESVELLIETVEGLLALAGRKNSREQEMVSLKDLTKEVAEALAAKADSHDICVQLTGSEMSVLGSRPLFYRAVYNVVDNAIKYNRQGGRVEIRLYQEGNWNVAEISDTGVGIPEESLASVFEPFYRVDSSRSKEIEGTGLGLAITKKVLEEYRGEVAIQSSAGTGTRVLLKFASK